jgi:DNA-directed RNA polymerase specialized sigma24 family protein
MIRDLSFATRTFRGYDAERPLGLITSEIEPEESLPEHLIPDCAALPPDAAISGQELVGILQQEIKHWPADEQQVFELHFLVGFETSEIAMIRRQSTVRCIPTVVTTVLVSTTSRPCPGWRVRR